MVCAPVGLASFIKDGFYSYGLCHSGVGVIHQMDSTVMVCAPVGLASFIKDGFYSYGLCPSGVGIIHQRPSCFVKMGSAVMG